MLIGGGGGGGPTWNGSIEVSPGSLEASSPAFAAAGNQVTESMASVMPWNDAAGTGITDPGAAASWSRLVTVWTADLNTLSNGLAGLSNRLMESGATYQSTDGSVMVFK